MEKIILLLLVLMTNVMTGQKLPNFNLSNAINSKWEIKSPVDLKKGEICLTFVQGGGMSGFDYYTHYIFRNEGNVQAFKEEVPKSYLKKLKRTITTIVLDEQTKGKLLHNVNSNTTFKFTAFSQKDFYKIVNTKIIEPPCVVDDASGYAISFIQDQKQKVYSFIAPEYYLSGKCENKNINKNTLSQFIQLLQLWEVL